MENVEMLSRFLQFTTGLQAFVWDGSMHMLENVECKHCFSKQLQPLLTKEELCHTLKEMRPSFIYEMQDLLDIHMIAFLFEDHPVLVGPFVTEAWNEDNGRSRLAQLDLSYDFLLPYKLYYCSYFPTEQSVVVRNVSGAITALLPNEPPYVYRKISGLQNVRLQEHRLQEPVDFDNALRRYEFENRFLSLIEGGHTEAAVEMAERMPEMFAIKELYSPVLHIMIANMTIMRTLVRKAAERGGVHPAEVDAISLAYAQKMYTAKNTTELTAIIPHMVRTFTNAVCAAKLRNYSPMVARAVTYLRLYLSTDVDMKTLADTVACTPGYLSHTFKAETGMTVTQYLTQERCNEASVLLLQTDLSVQEIGARVGYLDNSYFARVFKSCIGESPTAYRKKYQW